jgi:hypothetical protein
MTNPNDPAFPETEGHPDKENPLYMVYRFREGLTKREYFAAMALQGLCARSADQNIVINGITLPYDRAAITIADSLIAELSKEPAP